MNTIRKQRLIAVVLLVVGVTLAVGIALYALRENINLYFTPSELKAASAQHASQTVRLGGMVEKGSVIRGQGLEVTFWLTDMQQRIQVVYQGMLPDLFREGQGIVALGKLNAEGIFIAEQVLAKHDENYMPPGITSKKSTMSLRT